MKGKAVLLGMTNPYLGRALAPHPPGCAGWRLQQMSGLTREDYERGFDKMNLLRGRWSRSAARRAGSKMVARLCGRTVVVLGAETWRALAVGPRPEPGAALVLSEDKITTTTWHYLPHPSGRNLWYNDSKNRAVALRLICKLVNRKLV